MAKGSRGQWHELQDFRLYTEMATIAEAIDTCLLNAREEILLEIYIFEAGDWPARVLDILVAKAEAGVRVHLTLDAIGCMAFPRAWVQRLRQAGAHLVWYHRLDYLNLRQTMRRTHRRILVVDGRFAALGGFAIADAWLTGAWTGQPYRELMVCFGGPLATQMRMAFGSTHRVPLLPLRAAMPGGAAAPVLGKGRLLLNSPPGRNTIHERLLAAIRAARTHVWIATPYFNPDFWVRRALYQAAHRGVDVRILLPGPLTDHPILRHGVRRYYHRMLAAGVRIFEYSPAFLHSKCTVVDGRWATVGSANLDLLSHWFNRELNLECRGRPLVNLLVTLLSREFQQSQEITLASWLARPRWQRVLENGLGIVDRVLQKSALARYRR
ncbi:MAG: phospholipase D-like domain-containing protein [Pseudomonadota bacterium]|uniref:phospholipase D-like domain-containing protein n=1 Tax=Thermithiobacillus tepidarius TaxID=929 RepID=UPI0003F5E7AB|nr:phospholipase D-like domain-containing protein [Thermithiobacillus tepidarius]